MCQISDIESLFAQVRASSGEHWQHFLPALSAHALSLSSLTFSPPFLRRLFGTRQISCQPAGGEKTLHLEVESKFFITSGD